MAWYPGKLSKWLAYFQIRAEDQERAMSRAKSKPRVRKR